MKKLALALSVLMWMCGCGSNSSTPNILVYIAPSVAPSIDQGQTLRFTASLNGDISNQGVSWSATGPGCAGAACGTFTNVTSTSATYVAPATVSASLSVSVTANSVAQPGHSSTATFNVFPPPSIVTTALPNATPTYIYHTSVVATGGVQPLNWTLASGSLPAGISLNSAGIIFGTPTTGGTSTFTLKVTDSSPSAPLSAQQTFTLNVIGVLTVPGGTLSDGTVGIAYSATLPSSGGTPPLAWGIYSGSIPSGLVLQRNGVISGTPTTTGTYTFTVRVVDSSPVQQNFTSPNFTITINPAGPLAISTTALMDGTVALAYQGQLVATGGSPPLAWTVLTGNLPTGLALNPTTGAITGSPSGAPGTYSFTVQVSDSSSPVQTATQQLSITINASVAGCSSSGNDSVLVGQYAFSLRGYNGVGFVAVVGSLTADGAGNITAGEADTNGVLGAQTGNLITSASSYSVGPDNRGCATVATPFGTFYTRFALGGLSAGVATEGRIIEFENPGASAYIAAGLFLQQIPTDFISPLAGGYTLQVSGSDTTAAGRYACAGTVTGSNHKFSYLQQDCNDNGTVTNTVNIENSGTSQFDTYSAADANGRATGVLSVGSNTSVFTFYIASTAQLLIVNADSSPTFSGVWQQVLAPNGGSGFSQSSFLGNAAFYSNGLGLSGVAGDVQFGPETADGSSNVTSQLFRDIGGTWQTSTPSCTYSVVSVGRILLTGSACENTPPISYMYALNSAFVVGTDASASLGSFEPQTTGLTDASVAGTYFLGTSEVVSHAAKAEVGILNWASDGTVTTTTDTTSELSQSVGVAGSDTITLNSNGTLTTASSGGTTVGLAVSNNKFVIVNNPTLTFPTLQVGER